MDDRVLLNFIGLLESGGNYNAVYGNAEASRDLSRFTLDQIHNMQLEHSKITGSSAFGKYQFTRRTLLGLRTRLGLKGSELFTPELQDRMARSLLVARGFNRWKAGQMTDDAFMDSLAKEWASLPYRTGRSYYDGDGLNRALATREEFREVLKAMRA
ncbi:MAG: hypothetical protein ACUVR3_08495 [Candidatus Roseilinea sp.]|uniref:hypothetical protein n=1 Tax=Candidatus Roseilinea sp. TaxID=2838777 RepID=UPI0040491107